jgi:hypothetical protein
MWILYDSQHGLQKGNIVRALEEKNMANLKESQHPTATGHKLPGPRGNRQSWRHLDEVGRLASRAPDNKPGQRDEREYLE